MTEKWSRMKSIVRFKLNTCTYRRIDIFTLLKLRIQIKTPHITSNTKETTGLVQLMGNDFPRQVQATFVTRGEFQDL